MSNRMAIQWAIAEYVSDAATRGIKLDVTAAALQLSTKHPQSGYTLDDLCRLIEEAALSQTKSTAGVSRLRQKPSSLPEG